MNQNHTVFRYDFKCKIWKIFEDQPRDSLYIFAHRGILVNNEFAVREVYEYATSAYRLAIFDYSSNLKPDPLKLLPVKKIHYRGGLLTKNQFIIFHRLLMRNLILNKCNGLILKII